MSKSVIKYSIGIRLAIIAFLTLILLIPALMIQSLITERKERRDSAASEISDKWGNSQTLAGPVLSIPYYSYLKDDNNNLIRNINYAHFLPEDLRIEGNIKPEIRYRGLYEVVVYNGRLNLSGVFNPPDLNGLNVPVQDIIWKDAILSVGITDMKGIQDFIEIVWNEKKYSANPGIESKDVLFSGISINPLSNEEQVKKYEFNIQINLNGSYGLFFVPVGKETRVELTSDWNNPSFTGTYLPENREITKDGFRASWKILHLNRNFPQSWLGPQYKVSDSAFGVDLLLAIDEYQKTMRTTKYAILFLSLTFLTFFMIELLSKKVIHPIQYMLIGFALLIFYTLLLSLSEYLLFKYAYLIASAAIIILISLYSISVLQNLRQTGIITGILVLLYGYLYTILQLQDYALLMGSIGLFIVLAVVMYLTRRIDWFTIISEQGSKDSV